LSLEERLSADRDHRGRRHHEELLRHGDRRDDGVEGERDVE
jgi:hypothetical protein